MDNPQVLIEFTGISRVLTGESEFAIPLSNGMQLTDIVRSIGQKYPALVGEVIGQDGRSLIPTNLFSVNGKQILHENQLDFEPENGDRLILLSLLAGG